MFKAGSETDGFEIIVDQGKGLLQLRASGFWDKELAGRFEKAMLAAFEQLSGTKWDILTDGSAFVPQPAEVQAVIGGLMGVAPGKGMQRAANVVNKKLDELQLRRLASENKLANIGFFRTVEEARAWLGKA